MAERAEGDSSSSLDDFKNVKLLGEGAFAAVFKVIRHADGQTYALKKVKLPSLSDKEKRNALNEIRLLASVQQENIVSYKDAFFDDRTRCLCIITELCDGGDVMEQINRAQKDRTHIAESDIWRWLIGLGRALKALHAMMIFHRDMKSANVFLTKTRIGRIAKLGDFNVSTVAKKGLCMTQTGTPYYASPEVWRDVPYDGKSDMWGLGCIVYETAALHPPFRAEDMEGLAQRVCEGRYHRIPKVFSSALSDVIGILLQVNPRHRPSAEHFLALPRIQKTAAKLKLAEDAPPAETNLLSTMKVPKNLLDLPTVLPSPKYGKGACLDDAAAQSPISPPAHSPVSQPPVASPCRSVQSVQKENLQQPASGSKACASTDEPAPEGGVSDRSHHTAQQGRSDVPQLRENSHRSHSKAPTPNKASHLDPYRKRAQLPHKQQKANGARRMHRCRSDAVLPRKRREQISEDLDLQEDHSNLARPGMQKHSPEGPVNSLPRIQLNRVSPNKILPKGLHVKLPRIVSCPGQLV